VITRSAGADATHLLSVAGVLSERLGLHLVLAMVGLGLADSLLQARRYRARLRMTSAEARREHKEEEGAPELKAERRRLYHEWLAESEGTRVHEAELVLLDPGMVAVAIAYSSQIGNAPRLILCREGLLAGRLEAAARAAGVPTVVSPMLVRALSQVEVGAEIPEDSYTAVAELLAQAWRARRGGGSSS
jgi:flagellar biosynthetic protein FlhB